MAGILVFVETKDGKVKKVSREALSIGRKLAEAAGGDLIAFAGDRAAADDAGRAGAKKLYVANLGAYLPETYAAAMKQVIDDAQPSEHGVRAFRVVACNEHCEPPKDEGDSCP